MLSNMFLLLIAAALGPAEAATETAETKSANPRVIPAKTVVLTFDDAVQSHLDVVAPLLKKHGFGATFFVCNLWMNDEANSLSWEDIRRLHDLGFEIGNHSWTHAGFNSSKSAGTLEAELKKVDDALAAVGVPRPVSFGWPGNAFGPEAVAVLREHGIRFARRGMQPEKAYGEIHFGPLFDPSRYDALLIPTSGDAYPIWTLDHFKQLVDQAVEGKAVILQFHGVPDVAHPWVHTPPEMFAKYMEYLHSSGFHVIALRDLGPYIDRSIAVPDPMRDKRYP